LSAVDLLLALDRDRSCAIETRLARGRGVAAATGLSGTWLIFK